MKKIVFTFLCIIILFVELSAQLRENPWKMHSNVSLQSDVHYTTQKHLINERWSAKSYLSTKFRNKYLEAGIRLEELRHPLPGHEVEKGWGIPNMYLKGNYKILELTIGDFYEQFGSGMLLRSYEDRSLGVDNAIRGGRFVLKPLEALTLKFIGGQQRNYFDRKGKVYHKERGYLWGGDLDVEVSNWLKDVLSTDWNINVGASWITKNESADPVTRRFEGKKQLLRQPENVAATATRLRIQKGNWDIYTECAYKFNDPNASNNYIYRNGSAAMLTASYSRKGMSILGGVRRSENFDFRSERTAMQTALRINHLQPFTQQQTYTLAALYPYATQPNGEWAFQTELRYRLKKKTALGGKYGTGIRISASSVRGLDKKWDDPTWSHNIQNTEMYGTNGYKSSFFGMSEKYFHDIDFEISRKVSKTYSFVFTYMNQYYNQEIIEGHAENGAIVRSNIFVYEGKHKVSKHLGLRTELQYLQTKQAEKDWLFALVECSLRPHFILSVSDQWNIGSTGKHYYMLSAAGMFGKHRLQVSYGRTRKGINCSGGVCRLMPSTEGVYLSYNFNF